MVFYLVRYCLEVLNIWRRQRAKEDGNVCTGWGIYLFFTARKESYAFDYFRFAWPHLGLALVSVRSIAAGEEVLWNYRLHPREGKHSGPKYPPWYHPVDEDALRKLVEQDLQISLTST